MPYKGRFKPKYPEKYKGDAENIIYRSLWEKNVMAYFDLHPNVIWWGSEELHIPYFSPVDKKYHRYFPDFIVKMRKKNGLVMTYIIEVKPYKETRPPKNRQGKSTQTLIREAATYAVNQAKWKAADIFCQEHGWQFKILTEKELGL